METPNIPCSKSHVHILLPKSFQRICPRMRPCITFCKMLVSYSGEMLASCPTPSWESPLISHLRLLIEYIHNYPPYLEAISYICNLRIYNTVVTGTHLICISKMINAEIQVHEHIITMTINIYFLLCESQ
jgi:hypothetical protein